jgi:hypothetical protein
MKFGNKGEMEQILCVYETNLTAKDINDGYVNDQKYMTDTGYLAHMAFSKHYLTKIEEKSLQVTSFPRNIL